MFAEAIPACVIQTLALLQSPTKQAFAIVSILVSAFTTAFTSALIAYDFDTSSEKRRLAPDFYGFIPDRGRIQIFLLMVVLSACQILAKSLSIALLTVVSPTLAFYYLICDQVLYQVYKILRFDWIVW